MIITLGGGLKIDDLRLMIGEWRLEIVAALTAVWKSAKLQWGLESGGWRVGVGEWRLEIRTTD